MRLLVRDVSFVVSRPLLSASVHFSQLLDKERASELRVDADPGHFQSLLDVLSDARRLTGE